MMFNMLDDTVLGQSSLNKTILSSNQVEGCWSSSQRLIKKKTWTKRLLDMLSKVRIGRSRPHHHLSSEVDRNTTWRKMHSGTHTMTLTDQINLNMHSIFRIIVVCYHQVWILFCFVYNLFIKSYKLPSIEKKRFILTVCRLTFWCAAINKWHIQLNSLAWSDISFVLEV